MTDGQQTSPEASTGTGATEPKSFDSLKLTPNETSAIVRNPTQALADQFSAAGVGPAQNLRLSENEMQHVVEHPAVTLDRSMNQLNQGQSQPEGAFREPPSTSPTIPREQQSWFVSDGTIIDGNGKVVGGTPRTDPRGPQIGSGATIPPEKLQEVTANLQKNKGQILETFNARLTTIKAATKITTASIPSPIIEPQGAMSPWARALRAFGKLFGR